MTGKLFHFTHKNPDAPLRIFCFPYAGGGASTFHILEGKLPNIEIISIRLPGRECRLTDPLIESLDEAVRSITKNILPLLDKPFVFLGYSYGALICFELTRELERLKKTQLPKMLILSAKAAPHISDNREKISALPKSQFLDKISNLGATPDEILKNKELMDLLLPMLRADFSISETQISPGKTTSKCPACIFYGASDDIPLQQIMAWQDLFSNKIKFFEFSSGHFFIHSQSKEFISKLNSIINPILAQI